MSVFIQFIILISQFTFDIYISMFLPKEKKNSVLSSKNVIKLVESTFENEISAYAN